MKAIDPTNWTTQEQYTFSSLLKLYKSSDCEYYPTDILHDMAIVSDPENKDTVFYLGIGKSGTHIVADDNYHYQIAILENYPCLTWYYIGAATSKYKGRDVRPLEYNDGQFFKSVVTAKREYDARN